MISCQHVGLVHLPMLTDFTLCTKWHVLLKNTTCYYSYPSIEELIEFIISKQ